MAVGPAKILPLLTMRPEKRPTALTRMPLLAAEMMPALLMPPPNVFVFSMAMASRMLPPLAMILLLLSTLMLPRTVPISSTPPPLMKAALANTMPPVPIVPVLVTPPLKVVWLISISLTAPPNDTGNGPV
jgi:hypothetical protein